jgi:hypothetical protein
MSKIVAAYRHRILQPLLVAPEWEHRAGMLYGLPPCPNINSAATVLNDSEDQHRTGLLSEWMMTADGSHFRNVRRNSCRAAYA